MNLSQETCLRGNIDELRGKKGGENKRCFRRLSVTRIVNDPVF
jgi:hypothetical protein